MSACICCVTNAAIRGIDPAVGQPKRHLGSLGNTVRRWQARAKQRRELKALFNDTDFLKDIGVSSGDAMIEASKPFWKE